MTNYIFRCFMRVIVQDLMIESTIFDMIFYKVLLSSS